MADSVFARFPMPARVGVTVGLMSLVGIAYYVVYYSEVANKIEAEQRRRPELESELSQAKAAEAEYQKDLEELARRRERERELNKILPPNTEYPAFLASVQTIANMSGVELTAWIPQPEVKEDFYTRVPMRVELQGKFHQLAKFFYGIGQNDRIMNMENISIVTPTVKDREVVVKASGLATAFSSLSGDTGAESSSSKVARRGAGK